MVQGKLIELLRCFSNKQVKRFHDFVASPFFNNREEVTKLWRYLSDFAPSFNDEQGLKKEVVFHHIFPKKKFDDKELSYLCLLTHLRAHETR